MKVNIGDYKKKGKGRNIKVEISKDDTFSLDYTLALVIAPALKKYKEISGDIIIWPDFYPENYWGNEHNYTKAQRKKFAKIAQKETKIMLDKMIYAFEQIVKDDAHSMNDPKIQEGLDLFAKHYRGLWW